VSCTHRNRIRSRPIAVGRPGCGIAWRPACRLPARIVYSFRGVTAGIAADQMHQSSHASLVATSFVPPPVNSLQQQDNTEHIPHLTAHWNQQVCRGCWSIRVETGSISLHGDGGALVRLWAEVNLSSLVSPWTPITTTKASVIERKSFGQTIEQHHEQW
jgi:hypothetical protein